MSRLVLFTNSFPWGKGETFIDNEVGFYKEFESVTIIAHDKNNYRRVKDLNENIQCLQLPQYNPFNKSFWYLSSLFTIEFYNELRYIGKKQVFHKIYAIMTFIGKGRRLVHFCKRNIFNIKYGNIVYYSYWLHYNAYAAVKLAKKTKDSKCISRCHRYDLYVERSPLRYLPLRHWLINNLDTIFSISQDGVNYLNSLFSDIDISKIRLSRLGTPDYGYNYHSIKKDSLHIVSCSWINKVKRVYRIAEALKQMPQEYNIIWTHIGSGVIDKRLSTALKDIPNNIRVNMLGEMSNNDIHTFYQKHQIDVFINVSESEGVPVSIMEAISHGIPIIATNVGGTNEIIIDEFNGFLLQEDFTNGDIIKLLIKFLNMRESDYLDLQMHARESWENGFDANVNYKSFIELVKT